LTLLGPLPHDHISQPSTRSSPMPDTTILKIDDIRVLDRGGGVKTWPLVVRTRVPKAGFTTGMSVYPVGKGAPMHYHNCAEQVTLLEGSIED
jgi:hypothetical protein